MSGRTIVLGGGGITGIAWEIGVLHGLASAGADLAADRVLGTSAGSFVGAALAAGADFGELFDAQHRDAPDEDVVHLDQRVYQQWVAAYRDGGGDPVRIGRAFGRIAAENEPAVPAERRRQTVEHRLVVADFPAALRVAVQDAVSGTVRAFAASDGQPLADVVSASGAVPGLSPAVEMLGRSWIDGGMVSSANVGLVSELGGPEPEEVLVMAPLPLNHGGVPSVAEELESLATAARKILLVPDEASRAAIGANIYDASRRGPCADAGFVQGTAAAASLLA